jgi:hypothetical protein
VAGEIREAGGEVKRPVRARPWWATALAAFCAGTVVFLAARDLSIPHVRETEVWLGIEVHGRLALLTAPLHWGIFALGAWGFWRTRPWVWPWASVYAFSIAVGHLVWNLTSPRGGGWVAGLGQLLLFSIPAIALLGARPGWSDAATVPAATRPHRPNAGPSDDRPRDPSRS